MTTMFVALSLLGLLPEILGTLAQALEHRQIGCIFSAFTAAYLILGVLVAISISDLSLISS